jgi:hypothetical protein
MSDVFYPDLSGNGKGVMDLGERFPFPSFMNSISIDDYASHKTSGVLCDGSDDTPAFNALAADVNARGGGVVINLGAGQIYNVGAQIFAGATGKLYSFFGIDVMAFRNATKPIIIRGNGAKLKYRSGLKYGSFHPITGVRYDPVMPFTNYDYAASLGYAIYATDCFQLRIEDLEIDGNQANVNLGGTWGDSGRQNIHYGVFVERTPLLMNNVYIHHICLDGIGISATGTTATSPGYSIVLINVRSEYNARQGCSWVGGRGLLAVGCKFNHTGRGTFGSSPGAGLDIEAEGATCRAGKFIRCEFINNLGVGMDADSGDSADMSFEDCDFFGTSGGSYSVWPNKPRYRFTRCRFSGTALGNYVAATRDDATVFEYCIFGHEQYNGLAVYSNTLFVAAGNPIYKECSFISTNPAVALGAATNTTEFHYCTFLQNGSTSGNAISGIFYGQNKFTITTGNVDFSGYTNYGRITGSGTWLSAAATGGDVGSTTPPIQTQYRLGGNSGSYQINAIRATYAIPTTTFPASVAVRGDTMWNTEPVVGGPVGWMASAAGTPGTWSPFGILGGVQATSVAFAAGATPTKAEFDALITALKTAKLMA